MTPLLSIEELHTTITMAGPPVKAVAGVDLELLKGEILALVGESGCGKTMLALSIGQLLPAPAKITAGSIALEGQELTRLGSKRLRQFRGRKVAYIFQDPMSALNPVLSIGEQLIEALTLHQQLRGHRALERALSLLEQVKIPEPRQRIRQYPHQLSGGMRQRVMIAMALAGRPALLIADEPTTALDVTTQEEILQLLQTLQKELGMSLLLITHDLATVAPIADRVAVMYAGKIVEVTAAATFYEEPSHPYAQALLRCLPEVGKGRQTLQAIPGSVPNLSATPAGCPFHPRCPEVVERCRSDNPRLEPLRPQQQVSCWQRKVPQ